MAGGFNEGRPKDLSDFGEGIPEGIPQHVDHGQFPMGPTEEITNDGLNPHLATPFGPLAGKLKPKKGSKK